MPFLCSIFLCLTISLNGTTKTQQGMYFLKKSSYFNVHNRMLQMLYYAFIESVLTVYIICWFGNATEAQKKTVRKTITMASKLLGITLPSMEWIYRDRTIKKANTTRGTPFASSFELLPSIIFFSFIPFTTCLAILWHLWTVCIGSFPSDFYQYAFWRHPECVTDLLIRKNWLEARCYWRGVVLNPWCR